MQAWSHQPPAIQFLADHPYAALDCVMGGGKTYMAIQNFHQFGVTGHRRNLVLCPHPVMGVWRGEFEKHAKGAFETLILSGKQNSETKAKMVAHAISRQSFTAPLFVVMNYETMIRKPMVEVLSRNKWNIITADELHKLKGHGTASSKNAWRIGKMASRRLGLTGTLMPHDPGDIFGQYRFLRDDIFGRYWTHFRSQYATMNPYIPNAIMSWINQEEMTRKINLIRYKIGPEVLVLPDRQDITIEVPMSPSGMKIYQQMKKESIAVIKQIVDSVDGDLERAKHAIAANPAVRFLRLLQLAQGYVTDEDKEEVETDTEKRKALLELLEEANEPVCVYGWFKHDMKIVEKCCEILNLRYGEISGSRKDITDHGKFPENVDVMGVQCKSGSSGIDLTRSRIGIVMNSGMLSPGDYDQMAARQYRPGQTKNVLFYTLVSTGTVDESVRKAREQRRDIVSVILNCVAENLPW